MGINALIQDETLRREELNALSRVAYAAGTEEETQTSMTQMGREILAAFGADAITLYLLEGEPPALRPAFNLGSTAEELEQYTQIPIANLVSPRVIQAGRPHTQLVDDYEPAARRIFEEQGYGAIAAVPLKVRARNIGSLTLGFRARRRLDERQLLVFEIMGAYFADALEAQRLLGVQSAIGAENAKLYQELRRSSAELARLHAELGQRSSLATLGEFSAVVAHELRNPLGVVGNAMALLSPHLQSSKTQPILKMVEEELARMDSLVSDLLDFARPSSAQPTRVDAAHLLREVTQALAVEECARGLAINCDVEPGLPSIWVDQRLMRQALVNLSINAAQSMREGQRLSLRARAKDGEVCLQVEDEGPGIAPSIKDRLFEPFFTTKSTGTGLGLAVVKRVVEQHEGRISVQSELGKGSTFSVCLPTPPPLSQG
jgi:signal transduction histidine kinase